MKGFCTMAVISAQAAAFSMAKVPTTNFSPATLPDPLSPFTTRRTGPAAPYRSKITSLSLSPSTVSGLLVRGGGVAEAVALKSFYGDALGFFGGIRIPATFLAGSSLAAIFTMKGAITSLSAIGEDGKIMSKLEQRAIKFYHLISLVAFILSLNTIVTATAAYTSILHGRFDQMAETAYMMISREFEYEFISVRWSFLTSMFCFLGMVTSRVLIEFGLLKQCDDARKDVAKVVIFAVGALAAHLLSYVNQTLWCWRSLFGMTVHLAKLVLNRAFVEKRPLQFVSVFCTMVSVFYVGKLAAKDLKGGVP